MTAALYPARFRPGPSPVAVDRIPVQDIRQRPPCIPLEIKLQPNVWVLSKSLNKKQPVCPSLGGRSVYRPDVFDRLSSQQTEEHTRQAPEFDEMLLSHAPIGCKLTQGDLSPKMGQMFRDLRRVDPSDVQRLCVNAFAKLMSCRWSWIQCRSVQHKAGIKMLVKRIMVDQLCIHRSKLIAQRLALGLFSSFAASSLSRTYLDCPANAPNLLLVNRPRPTALATCCARACLNDPPYRYFRLLAACFRGELGRATYVREHPKALAWRLKKPCSFPSAAVHLCPLADFLACWPCAYYRPLAVQIDFGITANDDLYPT